MSRFRIEVADLLSHAGARRTVRLAEPVDGLANSTSVVVDPVAVDLSLERIRRECGPGSGDRHLAS